MQRYDYLIPLAPITKKNSQRLIHAKGRIIPIPSKQYVDYESTCAYYLQLEKGMPIESPCEITCKFYMPTRRRVDLTNLLEAIDDIMVHYGIIADDNYNILYSHDGSRVYYDKTNPRTEITIKVQDGSDEFV